MLQILFGLLLCCTSGDALELSSNSSKLSNVDGLEQRVSASGNVLKLQKAGGKGKTKGVGKSKSKGVGKSSTEQPKKKAEKKSKSKKKTGQNTSSDGKTKGGGKSKGSPKGVGKSTKSKKKTGQIPSSGTTKTSTVTTTVTTSVTTSVTPTVTTSVTPTVTPTGTPGALPINCPLKSASHIVVLGDTITNSGLTVLNGDVVYTTITGSPVITGVQHTGDSAASQARLDLTSAFTSLRALGCDVDPTASELGGTTLIPGVYCFQSSAQITNDLTLDAQGDPNSQFVFLIPSTLTTANDAAVVLTNGALACNVFFVVGSSATLGGTNQFNGNILASASISLLDLSIVNGNLYADTGAVTFLDDTINEPTGCGC